MGGAAKPSCVGLVAWQGWQRSLKIGCTSAKEAGADSSAAGHLGVGETYDEAAQRELQEELGIDTPLARVAKLPATASTDQEFIWIYQGSHDGPLKTDPNEIEIVWYSLIARSA